MVLLPLLGIGEHVVRFVDLLEALDGLRIVGIAVGVVLLGQPPELPSYRSRCPERPSWRFTLPGEHHHPGWPDEGIPHPVPGLEYRSHGVVLLSRGRGTLGNRLVEHRIEGHAFLIDPDQTDLI